MADINNKKNQLPSREYKYGFVSDVETEEFPRGLNEDVVRRISAIKNEPEFILDFRLKAFRFWQTMTEPKWAHVSYPPIDFQQIQYYSAPKKKGDGPKSLNDIDPELLATFNRLGIPLGE